MTIVFMATKTHTNYRISAITAGEGQLASYSRSIY